MFSTRYTFIVTAGLAILVGGAILSPAGLEAPARGQAAAQPVRTDAQKLQGAWRIVEMEFDGQKVAKEELAQFKLVFKGEEVTYHGRLVSRGNELSYAPGVSTFSFKLGTSQKLKTIDITLENDRRNVGIYSLEDDTLKLCVSYVNERPAEFSSKGKTGVEYSVLKREPQ